MVEMVAAINRQNFSGAQQVTCWTCHHGLDLPTTSIALDKLYGEPNDEKRDIVATGEGVPPATQILDQYIQAMGGAQKLSGLKSFIATGTQRRLCRFGRQRRIPDFCPGARSPRHVDQLSGSPGPRHQRLDLRRENRLDQPAADPCWEYGS